jgi:hypothetical protein
MKSLTRISAFLLLGSSIAQAQVGVSPSLNASFLQELRARDADHADEARDVLGGDRQSLDRGRDLSRPEVFKRFSADSERMFSDFTGPSSASPYQLGRKWFSPFYFGELSPSAFIQNKDGLSLGLALEFQTEYNSAVNFGKGGVIFSPTLLWDGSYQISPEQRFTFSGGLGLNWVSGNDRFESEEWSDEIGVFLLPGTSLAYDVDLGALHLTAYDRVSAPPYFGMLQNDLGLAATMDLTDRWSWTLNYTFTKTYDIDGEYGSYWRGSNFDQHTISTELVFKKSATLNLGLEAAWNWYQPDNAIDDIEFGSAEYANKAQFMNIGLFTSWQPSQDLSLRLAIGCQHFAFGDDSTQRLFFHIYENQTDDAVPYYTLALSQRLNEKWSHEFALGYERVHFLGGNYQLAHYMNYGITGEVWSGGQFTGSLFFEYIDSPELLELDRNYETTNAGIDLHLVQKLTTKLSVDVGYSTQQVYSDGDYEWQQHQIGLGLRYAINAKTKASLGWQSFAGRFPRGTDKDHHRLILSLRREF